MEWSDHGIVLSSRPHGETGLVTTLLTRLHGRHAGFVAGGISRKSRPTWQSGNVVEVAWRARQLDQLGHFTGELREAHAARAMDDAYAKTPSTARGDAGNADAIAYSSTRGVDDFVARVARATPLQLVATERAGVRGDFIKDLARRMDIPSSRIFTIIGVPKATAEKKKRGRFRR